MEAIALIGASKKKTDLIIEVAKSMGITVKKISIQSEDASFGKMIEQGMKTKSVSKQSVLDALK